MLDNAENCKKGIIDLCVIREKVCKSDTMIFTLQHEWQSSNLSISPDINTKKRVNRNQNERKVKEKQEKWKKYKITKNKTEQPT